MTAAVRTGGWERTGRERWKVGGNTVGVECVRCLVERAAEWVKGGKGRCRWGATMDAWMMKQVRGEGSSRTRKRTLRRGYYWASFPFLIHVVRRSLCNFNRLRPVMHGCMSVMHGCTSVMRVYVCDAWLYVCDTWLYVCDARLYICDA